MKEVGGNVIQKTKNIGQQAFDTTKDLVQHPVEHLDALAGKGQETVQASQNSTPTAAHPQTTSLEAIEKAAESNSPTPH